MKRCFLDIYGAAYHDLYLALIVRQVWSLAFEHRHTSTQTLVELKSVTFAEFSNLTFTELCDPTLESEQVDLTDPWLFDINGVVCVDIDEIVYIWTFLQLENVTLLEHCV